MDLKDYYLGLANKKYELRGITPSNPTYDAITVSGFEWNISIALIQKELDHLGEVAEVNRLKIFSQPQFRDETDKLSVHAMIFLKTGDYLETSIEAGAQEMNEMLKPYGLSLNIQETHENIKKIYEFLKNNPGGIEGNLIQSGESSGKTLEEMIAESISEKVSNLKTGDDFDDHIEAGTQVINEMWSQLGIDKNYQSLEISRKLEGMIGKDTTIVKTTKRLGGMNPSKMKGAEIFLDIMDWLAGFSSICTYATTCTKDPLMIQKFIDLGMKTLLDEPIEIDSEINELFNIHLNVLLHARKKEFLQMAQTAWSNPQFSHIKRYLFEKKRFLNSMKELHAFMKFNQGFKSL